MSLLDDFRRIAIGRPRAVDHVSWVVQFNTFHHSINPEEFEEIFNVCQVHDNIPLFISILCNIIAQNDEQERFIQQCIEYAVSFV